MINRIIVLSTLILAFALTINWVMVESEDTEDLTPGNEPDLYMLNATINQFDEEGELQHQIAANRFTHFPLTDLTTMKSPALALGRTRDSNPWEITSNDGRILPSSDYREEIVELWSNVLASKSASGSEFINIQTNSLTVYPERDYAETDEAVFIDNQSGRTTAAGMKAFLDTGKFMFYSTPTNRVTTIFLPN
ncbi:MAG: LPS export ABC transporter periplasmic protein LptC [Proteobacteria bacterium]|nr:LPS export ABC transporter periplasmic protein LptC [Pseudomonadota bacterium]